MDFHWCTIISGHLDFIPSKIQGNLTLHFPDSHKLNHRIIVASFVGKGSTKEKLCILQGFFIAYQLVRVVASLEAPIFPSCVKVVT